MPGGYTGKISFVDLTSGEIQIEKMDSTKARNYIGGHGLGARILFERQPKGVDPLGPENILGFTTGPLTGTKTPTGGRYILLAGYLLANTIFRTSPEPEPVSDTRYAVASIPQRYTIKVQAKSTNSIEDNDGKEVQNVHTSLIEEENTQSQNLGLTQGQNVSPNLLLNKLSRKISWLSKNR